jgi:hypothetical protein
MRLEEATELRKELERIEAAMGRIKALWDSLPGADDLDGLGNMACDIASAMDDIVDKAGRNRSRPEGDKSIAASTLWPGFPEPQVPADTSVDVTGEG